MIRDKLELAIRAAHRKGENSSLQDQDISFCHPKENTSKDGEDSEYKNKGNISS